MATILVVDDSAEDRIIAGACVREQGCSVIYAENGRAALELIEREQPTAVLSDLHMPEMDGLQLIHQLRRKYTSLPVILMTAMGSEEVAAEALRAGAVSYVPKRVIERNLPVALRAVLTAVGAAVGVTRYASSWTKASQTSFWDTSRMAHRR